MADNSGAGGDFAAAMRSAVDMVARNLGAGTVSECAKTLSGITLYLKDEGAGHGVELGADGSVSFVEGGARGQRVLTISTTRAAFHAMAHGSLNPGVAYARGDVALDGVPLLKLRGMDPLLNAIFQGYRAASAGVDYEQASAEETAGMFEEVIAFALAGFDGLLTVLDGALGALGVKFFKEKSLNRFELVWRVLDREVRKMLSFGREGAEAEPAAAGAAPKSLADRLRERLSTVVESTMAEISRMGVSGYLVKRLVVEGSFRNYAGADGAVEGFEVRLKNKLGTGTIIGFTPVKISGEVFGLELISIIRGKEVLAASDVSDRRPLLTSFGDELLIRVNKPGGLTPGRHKISLGVDMVGLGGVDVDYEEELNA